MARLGASKRIGRTLMVGALAATAAAAATITTTTAAHADTISKTITFHCADLYALNADGTLGNRFGPIPGLIEYPIVVDVGFTMTGPTEVFAGQTFTTTSPGGPQEIPAKNGTNNIDEVKNLATTLEVTGAAAIQTPVFTGGNVIGAGGSVNGNLVTISLPGTQTAPTSKHPGSGAAYFPGGSTFQRPQVDTTLTAGAAGTQIVSKVTNFETNSVVLGGALVAAVRGCAPVGDSTVGIVNVVAPPEPGAPNAVSDAATTKMNTPVTIDVLANDTPDSSPTQLELDKDSLALTSNPAHGTAAIVDGKVVYTPAAGYAGQDSFEYKLCSKLPEPEVEEEEQQVPRAVVPQTAPCDPATVNITVEAPVTPTTVAATPTTVAVAQTATELPRTGRTSAPLALIGLAMVLGGSGLVLSKRSARLAR